MFAKHRIRRGVRASLGLCLGAALVGCTSGGGGGGGGGNGDRDDGAGDEIVVVFSNDNVDAVQNGPTADTVFTIEQRYRITSIRTYHWNGGAGTQAPGSISLRDGNGTVVGTWTCSGSVGQGGAPDNIYWECRPDVEIEPGTYTVVDSDPDTWSQNQSSGGAGICEIVGVALGICSDDCALAGNGRCEDGGPGSVSGECAYGTDCADCGVRPEDDGSGDADDGFGDEQVESESAGPVSVEAGVETEVRLSDGTEVIFPALDTNDGPAVTQLTLERVANDQDLSDFGQEAAAPMRVLRFEPFDPERMQSNVSEAVPCITIPAEDAAGVDAETVTVARISDMYLNGEVVPGMTTFLPVHRDGDGNLVVTDYMFPDSILSGIDYEADRASTTLRQQGGMPIHPREIRYVAGTFRGSLDWRTDPVLVRMVPAAGNSEQRKPITSLDDAEQAAEEQKSIANVIVLIHGHNEQEKTGLDASLRTTGAPWHFSYKRDVWTNLYGYINEHQPELADCTAFYEFVYPTYRPVFTPTGRGERLDQALADALDLGLAQFIDANPDLNLYIVAHSMGGLVARAGIQLTSTEMHGAFRGLATWGTPHMGSPLVTLRYVLGAPPDVYRAGPAGVVTFPLGNLDNTLFALRRAIDDVQVDAPGTRDLRWALSHTSTPRELALDNLFSLGEGGSGDNALIAQYALDNGTWLYNGNLRELNVNDLYRLSSKIHALYGVTSKRARVETSYFWGIPSIEGGETAIGALVMPWLVDDPTGSYNGKSIGDSDGAVPLVSMAGAGVAGDYRDVGDIDHEEYFGAPSSPGAFTGASLAETTASRTLSVLQIESCPEAGQRSFTISGSRTLTGDDLDGWRADPVDDSGTLLCAPRPESVTYTYSATVVVAYDGVTEPQLEASTQYPDVYDVYVTRYEDPISVSGTVTVDVSPISSRFQDDFFTDDYSYRYELAEQGYSYHATSVGNSNSPATIVQSGASFSWSFTSAEKEWDPAFGPDALVLTYDRTTHDADTGALIGDGSPVTTQCSISGVSLPFYVRFHLN